MVDFSRVKNIFFLFQTIKELKLMVEDVLKQGLEGLVLKDLSVRRLLIYF